MEKISLSWPKNLLASEGKVILSLKLPLCLAIVGVAENSREKVVGLKTKNWERYELKRLKPQRAGRVQTGKSTSRGV